MDSEIQSNGGAQEAGRSSLHEVLAGLAGHFKARREIAMQQIKDAIESGEERHEIEWRERADCWKIVIEKLEREMSS